MKNSLRIVPRKFCKSGDRTSYMVIFFFLIVFMYVIILGSESTHFPAGWAVNPKVIYHLDVP